MFTEILQVLLISMSPVVELRGAIPFAILVHDFSPWSAYFWSVLGNIVPALVLIPFIGVVDTFLSEHSALWKRFFTKYLEKTRDNHEKKIELFKEFALVLLVAIPLPFTGVWTASLVAYIFGIPFRKAVPLIFLGVLIAGLIVLGATLGVGAIF